MKMKSKCCRLFFLCFVFTLNSILITHNYCYAEEIVLENFDNVSKFKQNKAPQSVMKVTSEPGRTGNALKIDYDLTKDHFVEIGAPVSIDLKKVRELTWFMKGDFDGSVLELKFVDEDGSTYGKKMALQGISKTDWKQFKLPIKDIHYLWGGDANMGKIKDIYIAVSRGLARKGSVVLDTLNYSMGKTPVDFDINLNQVGYHPGDKKFFIVRVSGLENEKNISGDFSVIETVDGTTVHSGKLEKTNFSDWTGAFLKGDFSEVDIPSKYRIKVKLKVKDSILQKDSYSFNINNSILSAMTLVHQLTYLNYQRCGIRCHKQDPVMGGWHDTLFDISKRMWSVPSLVYGLARYVEDGTVHVNRTPEGSIGDLDELIWGLRFITDMADDEGAVSWGGIEADFIKFMTYEQFIARIGPLKPEDDLLPRIKYPEKNFFATAFNLVAIVNAIPSVKKKDSGLASRAERVAEKAWQWLDKQPLSEAREYGAYLWAATELYKYNSDKKYLARVNEIAPKLLNLQALNFRQFENYACGDFHTSRAAKDFMYQYKYVSFNIAINIALINLSELLTPTDPLWFDIYYANYVFGENYLKGMASKTPYRQVAHGMEPENPKTAAVDVEWQPMAHAGVTTSIETTKEGKHSALTMHFEFGGSGEWAQLFKPVNMDLSNLESVSFDYKYSGPQNNLEFKFTDDKNTNFGSKLKLEPTDGWQTEEIGVKDLKYFWGNSTVLNLKNIKQAWFALAKISGGKGMLSLRNLQFTDDNGLRTKIPMGAEANETKYVQRYFAGAQAEKAAASFHGLNCDHLGLAYVAMKWGYIADDLAFEEFADNQVSWVLGLNPLNYSMLLGAGTENPSIMAEYYGKQRVNGIIPNGIVGAGPKDEPEWRGDGPSSGEDWLPHNAAYFAALSLLDTPSKVYGKILLNGNPVQNATVEIRENTKPVTRAMTNSAGLFGPITAAPQKRYKLIAYLGGNSAVKDISLLSGEKKRIIIDFAGDYQLDIKPEGKIEAGRKTNLLITASKNTIGKTYKLFLKGAKSDFPQDGVVSSEKLTVPVVPDGDKPLMAVFLIKGYPPVYKTFYVRSF